MRSDPESGRVYTALLVLLASAGCAAVLPEPASAAPPVAASASAPVRAVGCIGMTVSDADRSAKFYGEVLAFEKVADVEVAGAPYETLQGVFGARMRTVRNDLVHWQTTVAAADLDATVRRVREAKAAFVSPGLVDVPAGGLGARRATLVRDPDGHVIDLSDR